MSETKKTGIKNDMERSLIEVNLTLTISRGQTLIIVSLLLSIFVAAAICPNGELHKLLVDILLGILQFIWTVKRD